MTAAGVIIAVMMVHAMPIMVQLAILAAAAQSSPAGSCEHCDEACRVALRPVHCRGIDAHGVPILPPPSCSRAALRTYCSSQSPAAAPPPPLLTPQVVVAVGPGANAQESWAAYTLAAGLGLAMGGPSHPYDYCAHPFSGGSTGKCGVVTPADVGNRSAIYVGSRAAAMAGLHPTAAEVQTIGDDGFLCSASYAGSAFRVALMGGSDPISGTPTPRGTINAVFIYLHRLGLRWWTPYKDVDPTWTGPGIGRGLSFGMNLVMPACQGRRMFVPRFQYRSILSHGIMVGTQAATWNVQNHLNGGGDRTGDCKPLVIPASMGGMEMFTNDSCAASVYSLVAPVSCTPPPYPGHPPGSKPGFCHEPTRGHFHDHPEYFSLLSPSAPSNASCATAAGAQHCIRAHNVSLDSADPARPGSGWRVGGAPGKGPWQAQLCMSNMEMVSMHTGLTQHSDLVELFSTQNS